MIRRTALAAVAIASLGACAAGPLVPGKPREVRGQPLPPREVHVECFAMERGDEVRWRYAADAPVDFDVHYRDGKVVVMPVVRERSTADEGRFVALTAARYCLAWEAGRDGVTLDYVLELGRAGR